MSTEDFVRNFGRRTHHIAYEVADGERNGEKNVDVVVRTLRDLGIPFLADMVGKAATSRTCARSSRAAPPTPC